MAFILPRIDSSAKTSDKNSAAAIAAGPKSDRPKYPPVETELMAMFGFSAAAMALAAGVMMTHFHRSKVDGEVLAAAARAAGAPAVIVDAATETETARHFFEMCVAHAALSPLQLLCEQAAAACRQHVDGALRIEVVMVDFDGAEVVARA